MCTLEYKLRQSYCEKCLSDLKKKRLLIKLETIGNVICD